jgi:hypothetical protein
LKHQPASTNKIKHAAQKWETTKEIIKKEAEQSIRFQKQNIQKNK